MELQVPEHGKDGRMSETVRTAAGSRGRVRAMCDKVPRWRLANPSHDDGPSARSVSCPALGLQIPAGYHPDRSMVLALGGASRSPRRVVSAAHATVRC